MKLQSIKQIEGAESNVNSFVHELSHSRPWWTPETRGSIKDTAMSYNDDPSLPDNTDLYNNTCCCLLDLHGSEDDNPTSANSIPSQNRIEEQMRRTKSPGTKDDEIFGYDGNDEIRGGDGWM